MPFDGSDNTAGRARLQALANDLRHLPPEFEWNYTSWRHCACGRAFEIFAPDLSWTKVDNRMSEILREARGGVTMSQAWADAIYRVARDFFDIDHATFLRFFCEMNGSPPHAVADEIERYLAGQPARISLGAMLGALTRSLRARERRHPEFAA